MSKYSYVLTNRKNKAQSTETITLNINCLNPYQEILTDLLLKMQERRYTKLMYDFNDLDQIIIGYTDNDMDKHHYDAHRIKSELACRYDVHKKYLITDIKKLSTCDGCVNDSPGQLDHMQCSSGCLHDWTSCESCNPNRVPSWQS